MASQDRRPFTGRLVNRLRYTSKQPSRRCAPAYNMPSGGPGEGGKNNESTVFSLDELPLKSARPLPVVQMQVDSCGSRGIERKARSSVQFSDLCNIIFTFSSLFIFVLRGLEGATFSYLVLFCPSTQVPQ